MTWTDSISDDCKGCKWVNYSDHGGWEMRSRSRTCPVHGDGIVGSAYDTGRDAVTEWINETGVDPITGQLR